MNDEEVDVVELVGRLTVVEGTVEAHGNRLDAHDDTLSIQGRYIDGQQRETDQLADVVKVLQQVADQSTRFFAQVESGLRIAGLAWRWFIRPAIVGFAGLVGAIVLAIVTHLPTIVHGIDKLNALLSK